MKKQNMYVIIAILALFFGGIIYLLFRTKTLLLFSWLKILNINITEIIHINKSNQFQLFFVYSLPNGLWLFSAIILLGCIWKKNTINFLVYTSIFWFGSILFEVLQKFGLIQGTFDYIDLFSLLAFTIIGMIIYFMGIKGVDYETERF